jgi:hypothetical protein
MNKFRYIAGFAAGYIVGIIIGAAREVLIVRN